MQSLSRLNLVVSALAALGIISCEVPAVEANLAKADAAPTRALQSAMANPVVVPCSDIYGNVHVGCTLAITQVSPNEVWYDVNEPVVNAPNTDYPQMKLLPGDLVTVTATGCAQTGGKGLTWKSYLYPLPYGNDMYAGTVTIPGAVAPGTPIWTVRGKQIQVPKFGTSDAVCSSGSDLHIQLGYKDDAYSDNGYDSHDDGDFSQCADESPFAEVNNHGKPATVHIEVTHAESNALYSAQPFDLIPACVDDNYIFSNAHWAWQDVAPALYYSSRPETSQSTSHDDPSAWKDFLTYNPLSVFVELFTGLLCEGGKGHRDWTDVTYAGRMSWTGWDHGIKGDDDYNISMWSSKIATTGTAQGGLIRDPEHILMEFDSDETVDEFSAGGAKNPIRGGWWDQFHNAVDANDGARWIDGHYAIATGLVGIDEVHDANAGNEIHPVHALAIHLNTSRNGPLELVEEWAFFVRNFGDEGECGSVDHYLMSNQYTLRLPPRVDRAFWSAIDPTRTRLEADQVAGTADSAGPPTHDIDQSPAHPDFLYTVHLGNPDAHTWRAGTLKVRRSLTSTIPDAALCPVVAPPEPLFATTGDLSGCGNLPAAPMLVQLRGESTGAMSGDNLPSVWAQMTPGQQTAAARFLSRAAPVRPEVQVVRYNAQQAPFVPAPAEVPLPATGPLADWQWTKKANTYRALCAATSGQVPTLAPSACAGAPPFTDLQLDNLTLGNEGWSVTVPTATLTTTVTSPNLVAYSEYSVDGAAFVRYRRPFSLPEGMTVLSYRSVDSEGVTEPMDQYTAKVDSRPPSTTAQAKTDGTTTTLKYYVSDPAPGSGPAGLHVDPKFLPEEYTTAVRAGELRLSTGCTDMQIWAEDVAGNRERPVHIPDAQPPSLALASKLSCLWPPNHARIILRLGRDLLATASDACDPQPSIRVVSVSSDEPDTGLGSGDMPNDVSFSSTAACIRRERSGRGSGRTYTIVVEARDYTGNATQKSVTVTVPHSDPGNCDEGEMIAEEVPCE